VTAAAVLERLRYISRLVLSAEYTLKALPLMTCHAYCSSSFSAGQRRGSTGSACSQLGRRNVCCPGLQAPTRTSSEAPYSSVGSEVVRTACGVSTSLSPLCQATELGTEWPEWANSTTSRRKRGRYRNSRNSNSVAQCSIDPYTTMQRASEW